MANDDVLVKLRLLGASRFQRDADKSGRSVDRIGDRTERATRRFRLFGAASIRSNRLVTSFGVAARGAGLGLLAGGAAATAFAKKAFTAFEESEKVSKQTEAVIKSTGGAANVTAQQVAGLAERISAKTGIDDETIQSGQNMLLTFKQIRNETGKGNKVFDQATRTLVNMSTALGKDPKTAAIQLGKALNDPVKGITALSRVGVQFTDAQKQQIDQLVKSGDVMGAQKLILRELNSEFGGSAKAQATTSQKLATTWENPQEKAGGLIAPFVNKAGGALVKFLGQMQDGTGAGGRFVRILQSIGKTAVVWFGVAKRTVQTASTFIQGFLARNQEHIDKLVRAFRNLGVGARWVFMNVLLPVARRALPGVVAIVKGGLKVIGGVVKVFSSVLTGDFRGAWRGVKQIFSGGIQILGGVIRTLTAGPREAAARMGAAIKNAFVGAVKGVGGALKSVLTTAINAAIDVFNTGIDLINAATPGKVEVLGRTIFPGIPDIPRIGHVGGGGERSRGAERTGGLARGGPVLHDRDYMVGERGPELVRLPRGASVIPAPLPAGAGGGLFRAHIEIPVQLNGREIARANARVTESDLLRRS